MIPQQNVELTTAKIVEANQKRIVIEVSKDCYLNCIIPHDYFHDHFVGEVVPLLAILRITRHGQIIQPPKQ